MAHFGIISPAMTGHLNPMCALGKELKRRGHRVTLFGIPDIQSKVEKTGLDFCMIGETFFPLGSLKQVIKQLGEMRGLAELKFTIRWLKQETLMFLNEAPEAVKVEVVDALLIDQMIPCGSVADKLNIPFITVCNALLLNREPGVPPSFTGWSYSQARWAHLRNRVGYFFGLLLIDSFWEMIAEQRKQWNLLPYTCWEDTESQLAQICQLPIEFDFPRVKLPKHFHYTGPLHDPSGSAPISFSSISFPFEKLTGQTLIYASLGTQSFKPEIFHKIAESCVGLDVQLVIALGSPDINWFGSSLPGSPLVVSYAPQQQLIEKASLVITHAGLNTTLEALSRGVPLIAIPNTNEQPGVAARIVKTGTGKAISQNHISVKKLQESIKEVLTQNSYKKNALKLKEAIRQAGGVNRAADIVEQAVSTKSPVLEFHKSLFRR